MTLKTYKAETGTHSLSSRDGLRLLTMADQKGQNTMTPEKTYQLVCEMLHSYDSATGNDVAEKVISDTPDFLCCFNPFYESAAALLLDARERMDKKTSPASVVSAVKRICKSAVDSNRMCLGGLVFQNGYYCLCDGYRILRLKEDITSLPHLENSPDQSNLGSIMKQAIENQTLQIALPDPADVKVYISRIKAKGLSTKEVSYQLSDGVYVNPQYLLDMLQALPGCTCYTDADRAGKVPIYFIADNGDGILLPVIGTPVTL